MAVIDKTWSPGPGCCRPGHERGKLQLSRGSPAKLKTLIPVFVLCRFLAVDLCLLSVCQFRVANKLLHTVFPVTSCARVKSQQLSITIPETWSCGSCVRAVLYYPPRQSVMWRNVEAGVMKLSVENIFLTSMLKYCTMLCTKLIFNIVYRTNIFILYDFHMKAHFPCTSSCAYTCPVPVHHRSAGCG